jgi:hypothetical protein
MLEEKQCKELFNKIVFLREASFDEVEDYSHAVYGFSFSEAKIESCVLLEDGPEVYSVLRKIVVGKYSNIWDSMVLYTEGWAAPVDSNDPDCLPSKHPESRRIKMICVIHKGSSSIRSLIVSGDEEFFDNNGHGKLADVLLSIYTKKDKINHVAKDLGSFYY